jgi:hypothetical protein
MPKFSVCWHGIVNLWCALALYDKLFGFETCTSLLRPPPQTAPYHDGRTYNFGRGTSIAALMVPFSAKLVTVFSRVSMQSFRTTLGERFSSSSTCFLCDTQLHNHFAHILSQRVCDVQCYMFAIVAPGLMDAGGRAPSLNQRTATVQMFSLDQ